MLAVQFEECALVELENQLAYLVAHDAKQAAQLLEVRIREFVVRRLALFPQIGHKLSEIHARECWIPKTNIVLWYAYNDTELRILHIWHTVQSR